MGGCASKPKEFNKTAEAPIKSKKSQPETGDRENADGGENKTEKPLVQVSESKEEAQPSSKPEDAAGEPVSSKDDDAEAASKNDDDKVEPVKTAEVDRKSSKEEAKSYEPIKVE